MVVRVVHYVCQYCAESFDNEHQAREHEKECEVDDE